MATKVLYFAWLRERIGLAEETVDLPETVTDVTTLLGWLAGRGDGYAYALENPDIVRVALDQQLVHQSTPIGEPREIALFPPMTGG
ncbi:molybdopterin converting factor subunit 1 [Ahrensia sp. R2A130]|uniref:molybdopterin converting factor subunit 1 n=1 Tax=Ahrensia sp. R2A130 TaxID=744979 RepID=UPI0001E09424|nr:molybdopterin converting factor subunit 1 [Ahrensia sp. R2A130]EFL90581.1 molybdopterin converting factor, subunit 1 [Ahrensia sp. R2A130]